MRIIFVTLVLTLSLGFSLAQASESIIKDCNTTLTDLDTNEKKDYVITVLSTENGPQGYSEEVSTGVVENLNQTRIIEDSVRENLNQIDLESDELDTANLNAVERLILHAIFITSDESLNEYFSAGMDLTKVRSAKVYLLSDLDIYGSLAIVEAKDAEGKPLGSFFGGLAVTPCK
jgi:hypothetical protein